MTAEGGKSACAKKATIGYDLGSLFPVSVVRTRKTKIFAYGFVMAFVACTAILAFNPSGNGSPWFNSLFTSSISSSIAPYRSHINNFISHIFPNSTTSPAPIDDDLFDSGQGVQQNGPVGKNVAEGKAKSKEDGRFDKKQVGQVAELKNNGVSAVKSSTAMEVSAKNQSGSVQCNKESLNPENQSASTVIVQAKNQTTSSAAVQSKDQKSALAQSKNQSNQSTTLVSNPPTSTKKGEPQSKNQTTSSAAAQSKDHKAVLAGAQSKNKTITLVSKPAISMKKGGLQAKNETKLSAAVQSKDQKSALLGKSENQTKTLVSNPTISTQEGRPQTEYQTKSSAVAQTKNQNTAVGGVQSKNQTTLVSSPASSLKKVAPSNFSESLRKNNAPVTQTSSVPGKKMDDWIKGLVGCDMFHGEWVKDDSYPLYPEGSCPHIDEPFNCYVNGRPDKAYQKLRWQPVACKIPRFNSLDLLERLRSKRLVFVGDSLNRNMWESLVCVLRNAVKDKKKVFEASGRHEFRTEGSYSFLFTDYNCSIEFFRSPFLVQEWEMPASNGKKKETLRLDIIERSSSRYKDADIIVFNTGHWWTHEKTSKGRDYYQEGNRIYSELNVVEAFHKALDTWAKWVNANVNSKKTLVFFRGYSASHFSGGQWNSGGACDRETEPIKNEKYLRPYSPKMRVLEGVLSGMKTPVTYLNITRMTDFRKDAHPSIYRKQNLTDVERRAPERFQDCSHWCLPGVPDSWNELLYAQILIKQHQIPNW